MYASLQWWVRGTEVEWQSVVLFYGDAVAALVRGGTGLTILDIEREVEKKLVNHVGDSG